MKDMEKASKPATKRLWNNDDLAFALDSAAEFLELEEWPEDDGGAQVAAYKEAARRIRRMAARVPLRGPEFSG